VLGLVIWRYGPPPPRGVDTPPTEFSSARAREVLVRLLGRQAPHPTGSAANAAVRGRLLGELRALALEPIVDTRLSCRGGRCAVVHNVLARIPGSDAELSPLLLATHYDSVAAGPGASDDATGVAVSLEVARAVLAGPRLRRDLVLLIDDGEEQALLGAQAFVHHTVGRHPWTRKVGAVVNLEARGTSGASLLFELSPGNSRLVAAAAGALRRPATNSIYYAIYQRLPNDTDLTVFREAGLPGVNFAFVGAPLRYHTPRDDLRHADRSTLQHHGDNALAMVRALGEGKAAWDAKSDAVFFDLLTFVMVRWPAPWTPWLAFVALALVLAGSRRLHRHQVGPAAVAWAAGAVIALLVFAGAAAWGLLALLRALGALPYAWIAEGRPLELAFWGAALMTAGAIAGLWGGRLAPGAAWIATWTLWALLGVAVSFLDPSLSYPFVATPLVAGAFAALLAGPPQRTVWLALPPLLTAAALLFPFAWFLFTGMGEPALLGVAAIVALALSGLLPALAAAGSDARWGLAVAALSLTVVSSTLVLVRPPFTPSAPQPLPLVELHLEQPSAGPSDVRKNGDGVSRVHRWLVPASGGPLPREWWDWSFSPAPVRPLPWLPSYQAWAAEAPGPSPPQPELAIETVEEAGAGLVVRARLRSPRGAPWAGVFAPAERLLEARVDGARALDEGGGRGRGGGWIGVEHVTLPPDGAQLELSFRGVEPVELWLWDGGPGVSPSGSALLRARPEWAVPIHRGDRTLVGRRLLVSATAPAAATAAPATPPPPT
jgi:hypothetical protein